MIKHILEIAKIVELIDAALHGNALADITDLINQIKCIIKDCEALDGQQATAKEASKPAASEEASPAN